MVRIGTNFEGFFPAWCTAGGSGWARLHGERSGFSVPAGEVFEVTLHLESLGKAKSRDGICLGDFFCLLWEAKR